MMNNRASRRCGPDHWSPGNACPKGLFRRWRKESNLIIEALSSEL